MQTIKQLQTNVSIITVINKNYIILYGYVRYCFITDPKIIPDAYDTLLSALTDYIPGYNSCK